jgi:hypothetical protein
LPAVEDDEDDEDPDFAGQTLANDEEVGFDLETWAAYFPEFMNTDDNFTSEQQGPHSGGPDAHIPEPGPIITDIFAPSADFVTEHITSSLFNPTNYLGTPISWDSFGARTFSEAFGCSSTGLVQDPPFISLPNCRHWSYSDSYHNYDAQRLLETLRLG